MAKFFTLQESMPRRNVRGERPAGGYGGGNVADSAIQLAKHSRLRVDSGQSWWCPSSRQVREWGHVTAITGLQYSPPEATRCLHDTIRRR